jgi:FAD/FMN-containing dehydrogenase
MTSAMTPAQARLLDDLRVHLPAKALTTDPADIAAWEIDWRGRYHGHAPALLAPATTAEVALIVSAARDRGVALVPQGGNTSMVGGATPPGDGSALILSLRRLNRIRRLDPGANVAVAEAGVVLQTLQEEALAHGRRFPLTLGARGSATIGGLVSTNAGGTQVLRFGTMRRLVRGLEAVLPDGTVHNGLSALKKDNRGYDLDGLLVGAEGTLGVVTAASLTLVPSVAARAVAWLGVEGPATGLALLRRLEAATDGIESFEILPQESLDAVIAHVAGTRPPLQRKYPWHLLVEVTAERSGGEGPDALLAQLLEPALADGTLADAVIAGTEAQTQAFWHIRDSISASERALGPATQHDVAVAVEAMPRFMIDAATACEARFPGTRASGFGHLGDGNIHFHVRAPAGAEPGRWFAAEAPAITRFVHDLVAAAGGSISAEHGIGLMKLTELARLHPERAVTLRSIKRAFDPQGLFNPGKLVALAPDPAVS